jgi:hypothetical protein
MNDIIKIMKVGYFGILYNAFITGVINSTSKGNYILEYIEILLRIPLEIYRRSY